MEKNDLWTQRFIFSKSKIHFPGGKYPNLMTHSLQLRGKFCDVISPKLDKLPDSNFCNRHAFMAAIALAKVHLSRLMVTLIFGIWASEPFPRPGKKLRRLDLIGLRNGKNLPVLSRNIFHISQKKFVQIVMHIHLKG